MFEKEAIRHAFEDTIGVECLVKPVEDFTYEELSDEQQEKAYDFKKGAEFGYNKANEWHFVKDGDLPKIGEKVLSEKGDLVIYKGDGFNWVEYSPNADNIKLRKWEEPRAWKEIVFPKESE